MSILAVENYRSKAGPLANLSPSNPFRIAARNPAPSAVGAVIGTQIFNNSAAASNVLNSTIQVGGYTAAIATTVQLCSDSYKWFQGQINGREVGRRVVRNVTVNSTAVVGGAGGSAVGGAIGTVVFPGTGTVVGSVLGGVFGSISFGTLVNEKFEDWWRGYHITYVKDDNEVVNVSLQYFGFSPNDVNDTDIVNMDSITQRYKEYAKIFHPDKGGTKEEWLTLVNHFAILSDAIKKRDKNLPESHKASETSKLKKQIQEERNQYAKDKMELTQQLNYLKQQNMVLTSHNNVNMNSQASDLEEIAL